MDIVDCWVHDSPGGAVIASGFDFVDGNHVVSRANVSGSKFVENRFGLKAENHAQVYVERCETEWHSGAAFAAYGEQARVNVSNSKSTGDRWFCSVGGQVSAGGQVTKHNVVVNSGSPHSGCCDGS